MKVMGSGGGRQKPNNIPKMLTFAVMAVKKPVTMVSKAATLLSVAV